MKISRLFRTRDKPEKRTVGSAYAFLMGGSTSGKSENERSAMQMTAVYACVRILSEAIAGLPLHMYRSLCLSSMHPRGTYRATALLKSVICVYL